ncbi:hypothetical protein ACVWYF_000315 [Hymenobacter sp. UYAg731]
MPQPIPEIYYPPASPPDSIAEAPESVRAASPYRTVPNRYREPQLLPDSDYQLDDTLTEEAGMARNPGVLGAYAGSF